MKAKIAIAMVLTLGSLLRPFVYAEPAMEKACIQIDSRVFRVEVAQTPLQQQHGLQYRKSLAANHGMIFPYNSASQKTFWMKDCKIALDLLFFKEGQLVDYVDSAPPCHLPADKCPLYTSKAPTDLIVELKAGTRRKHKFTHQSVVKLCRAT